MNDDQPHAMTAAGPMAIEPGSFADGYRQGRDDTLFALARSHAWAVEALVAECRRALAEKDGK